MMRTAFADHDYLSDEDEFVQYSIEHTAVRLVGLDTLIPGAAEGELCDTRLTWLDETLKQQPDRPTVLFMHHPPFDTGIVAMDKQGFRNPEKLATVLRGHKQVRHIICGHVHRPIHVQWHGVTVSIGPSASHYVALDLNPADWPHFFLEPPSCQLYYWKEGTGLIAHQTFVGDYAGPYRFFDDAGKLID